MADDWDVSSDDEPPAKPKPDTTAPVDWDDSEPEEEDDPPSKENVSLVDEKDSQNKKQNSNSNANSNATKNAKSKGQAPTAKPKPKPKSKGTAKAKPQRQVSKPSSKMSSPKQGDDSDTSTSSDSDDDDDNGNSKMQTYDERNTEDNAQLFGRSGNVGGGRGGGRGGRDNRVMLSGDVRLQSFPLGSQQDCVNLARQLSAAINQKRFEGDINSMDIVKFVTYMIDGLVSQNSQHLDIVDINEIKSQVDKVYNRKQKDLRQGKKKKKPIFKIGKKYASSATSGSGNAAQGGKHVDGHYNPNDFDFLN